MLSIFLLVDTRPVVQLKLWADSHFLHMMVQIKNKKKGQLKELQVETLRNCCYVIDLDIYIDSSLVQMLVMRLDSLMGK